MKVGDLVRRKDPFADWQEDNPWMQDKEMIGVIVETANPREHNKMGMVCVHWFTDGIKWWYGAHKIEVLS